MPKVSCVRVTCVPYGDAPEEIREKWIGLVIPLLYEEPVEAESFGPVTGKAEGVRKGWAVSALVAFCLLLRLSPGATHWWLSLKGWSRDDVLMFGVDECEEVAIDEDEVQAWMVEALDPLSMFSSFHDDPT